MKFPRITDVLFDVVLLAIIYMLVRPGSPAAAVIQSLTSASAAVISTVTGNTGGTK